MGGGELLLTSLVVYENQLNERIVLSHLEELNKKQVSGLIIAEDNEKFVPNILTQYEYIRQKRENIEYIKKINKSKARCYLFLIFAGKFSTKNEN